MLTTQEHISVELLGQQKVSFHTHILEAACKGPATQMDGVGPRRPRVHRGCRTYSHRTRGHTELAGAALVPEPQLQGSQVECHFHLVPMPIV